MVVRASDGPTPHSPSLRLGLPAPQHPSHRDATPHFMTQERIMFSNTTPSEPRLSPATTMSDATPSSLTPPLHCASICCSLQHLLNLSLLSLGPSLLQFVSIVSPHSPSLRFGLPAPQPSRRHHAQSLLGPSFHDPGTHHVLESHPERAAPLSRHDDERCHAIVSHSVLALRLHLAACSPSSSCRF